MPVRNRAWTKDGALCPLTVTENQLILWDDFHFHFYLTLTELSYFELSMSGSLDTPPPSPHKDLGLELVDPHEIRHTPL